MNFNVSNTDGLARSGTLKLARRTTQTPAFMPVGTSATVKAMTPEEVRETGAEIILANTFHLMLRPGTDIIAVQGGLREFTHWQGPMLTDSGGYQVFSLCDMRNISEQGVTFRSPINGDQVFLGPEESIMVQHVLGSDIIMCFDECTPYPVSEEDARRLACIFVGSEGLFSIALEIPLPLPSGIIQGGV